MPAFASLVVRGLSRDGFSVADALVGGSRAKSRCQHINDRMWASQSRVYLNTRYLPGYHPARYTPSVAPVGLRMALMHPTLIARPCRTFLMWAIMMAGIMVPPSAPIILWTHFPRGGAKT